jgi:hypothetical protein
VGKSLFYRGPSLAILHEKYAKQGRIDQQAPIQSACNIQINAPVRRVWERLIDLPSWPTIDRSFRSVQLAAPVAVDTRFHFVLYGFPIAAKLAVVNPERELTWTGASLWFKAIDRYVLASMQEGSTRLYLTESFAGVLATLVMSSSQLEKQHQKWLTAFKQAVEYNH